MRQKFSLDFAAENKEDAVHQAYSALGSRHKAKRRTIKIESTIEIDPRTSTEARILHEFREHIAASGGPIAQSEEE